MATKRILCAFHFLLGVYYTAFGDKVAQKIYQDLKFVAPCVVLTNATHQIGCTSSVNGHVGVIHYVQQKSDVEWILAKGKHAPYIPIFRADQFDVELLKPLIDNKKISGALVIAVDSGKHRYVPSKGFSPDYPCPNDDFGMYKNNSDFSHCKALEWNKDGNAMSFSYYDIPIIAVANGEEVDDILQCFNKYNNLSEPDYPLCAAELKDFMFAAKDTPTCMRKTKMPNLIGSEFCQPLGDWNVWGTLYPIKEPLKEKEVVMLAAKLDSSSFFHNLAPGVDNDGTGIVVALAVANALGELKRNGSFPATKKHIMFTFFQGESWDYIGSSRMVYDMEKGEFPTDDYTWKVKGGEKFRMKTDNIKYYVELSQVGLLHDNTLWAHSDPVSRQTSTENEVKTMLRILSKSGRKHGLTIGDASNKTWQPLPPASFQRFLRSDKNIAGLVLTDHKEEYKNKYYNSRFDDLYQAGGNFSRENDTIYLITDLTKRLAKVASTVARALFTLANDGEEPDFDIKVEDAVVGHLAFCFFNRSNCPLYKEVFDKKSFKSLPKLANQLLSRYVSVHSNNNPFTTAVTNILLYFIGYHFPGTGNCSSSEVEEAAKMQGRSEDGICVKGPVYHSPALSPAFVLEQYGSTEYSTWAESTWYEPSVRIFLVASPQLEGVTLASGLIMTILSFGVVFFVNKKADLIFTPNDPLESDLDG